LRIVYDITPALRPDPSGIAYYIVELITQCLRLAPENRYTMGIRPGKWGERGFTESWGWGGARRRPLVPPWFQLFTGPVDLFHSLGSLRVLGAEGSRLRAPLGLRRKLITLHDLIPIEGWYVPNTERWIAKRTRLLAETVRRVDAIVTDSEFVKQRILSRFDFPAERIRTVWLGLNPERFRPRPPEETAATLRKLGIDRPFAVSFSAMYPRKNTAGLVRAFARARGAADGLLLLGGNPKGDVYEQTARAIADCGVGDRVRFLGYVEHDDVPALYAAARLSVFPSLYEGFGLPVVEAMACGTPIATSQVSSMPEICSDAAEYFDPESVDSMAAAIERAWSDEARRHELRARGLERSKLFRWERTARETLAFYGDVARLEPIHTL
jgi:glycosyltransferase involved in cell wall biosynthesis